MIEAPSAAVAGPAVERVRARAYTIPTDRPESDGTFEWDATTIVIVEVDAGGSSGVGWTYAAAAVVGLIVDQLAPAIAGANAFDTGAAHRAMRAALRNAGYPGAGAMAASAVDVALHDLKAKLLDVSLAALLGRAHEQVPVYGSGGFCSYTNVELAEQLQGWVADGLTRVKMKIGRDLASDPGRVRAAREAIGENAELYVDANGALAVKQAQLFAQRCASEQVSWFEEPVSSLDLEGLRRLRELAPQGMEIAAGEYAATLNEFEALAGSVDCLQADATRCGGVTGLLAAAAVAEAHELDLSGHTAPTIHGSVLTAVRRLRHLEWFHDHVRIERMLFDGFVEPERGSVRPDLSAPGLGVEFKRADAERYGA